MVAIVESACKKEGVEFLGWTRTSVGDSIRLRKGDVYTILALPYGKLDLMSVDTLAKQIHTLFVVPSSAS